MVHQIAGRYWHICGRVQFEDSSEQQVQDQGQIWRFHRDKGQVYQQKWQGKDLIYRQQGNIWPDSR